MNFFKAIVRVHFKLGMKCTHFWSWRGILSNPRWRWHHRARYGSGTGASPGQLRQWHGRSCWWQWKDVTAEGARAVITLIQWDDDGAQVVGPGLMVGVSQGCSFSLGMAAVDADIWMNWLQRHFSGPGNCRRPWRLGTTTTRALGVSGLDSDLQV